MKTGMTIEEAAAIVKQDQERQARRRDRQRKWRIANAERLRPRATEYLRRWRQAEKERLQEAKAVLAKASGEAEQREPSQPPPGLPPRGESSWKRCN